MSGTPDKKSIAVAICHYLPENEYLQHKYCIPLQLGYAETGIDFGIQRDDEGDNRSGKHFLYSEYSGIYWLWKNSDADYKGILQHRRSFTTEQPPVASAAKGTVKNALLAAVNVFIHKPYAYNTRITCFTDKDYLQKLNAFLDTLPELFESGYEIIVPKPYRFCRLTVGEHFDEVITRVMLRTVREYLSIGKPDYAPYFEKTWKARKLYYANIEIMTSELYDQYCQFVFDVFDAFEENLVKEGVFLDPSREMSLHRTFGYLGELLTNTFVIKKRVEGTHIKEMTVLFNMSSKGNETTDYSHLD